MDEIKVTVYCLAFNHEAYIRDALEGFVNQNCNFRYEVYIHDDASTDGTAAIIKEYADRYPDLIKPILQKENQYSKKVNIFMTHIYPIAKGKYIAVCEGDDYWIDSMKLQKQVDYMDAHDDCTFCCTNGQILDASGTVENRTFVPYSEEDAKYFQNKDQAYTLHDMYQLSFVPTASFMYRRDCIERFPESYYIRCQTGDLKLRLYTTALGYMYYINDITCVYRQNVPNSAMTRWRAQSSAKVFERSCLISQMIENVDRFTNYEYTEGLYSIQKRHLLGALMHAPSNRMLNTLLEDKKYLRLYRESSAAQRIKMRVKAMLPTVILEKIRKAKR